MLSDNNLLLSFGVSWFYVWDGTHRSSPPSLLLGASRSTVATHHQKWRLLGTPAVTQVLQALWLVISSFWIPSFPLKPRIPTLIGVFSVVVFDLQRVDTCTHWTDFLLNKRSPEGIIGGFSGNIFQIYFSISLWIHDQYMINIYRDHF